MSEFHEATHDDRIVRLQRNGLLEESDAAYLRRIRDDEKHSRASGDDTLGRFATPFGVVFPVPVHDAVWAIPLAGSGAPRDDAVAAAFNRFATEGVRVASATDMALHEATVALEEEVEDPGETLRTHIMSVRRSLREGLEGPLWYLDVRPVEPTKWIVKFVARLDQEYMTANHAVERALERAVDVRMVGGPHTEWTSERLVRASCEIPVERAVGPPTGNPDDVEQEIDEVFRALRAAFRAVGYEPGRTVDWLQKLANGEDGLRPVVQWTRNRTDGRILGEVVLPLDLSQLEGPGKLHSLARLGWRLLHEKGESGVGKAASIAALGASLQRWTASIGG